MITVAIPVGPDPIYKELLPECIESVRNQTTKPDEILIIDDQAHLDVMNFEGHLHIRGDSKDRLLDGLDVHVWKTPWLVGVPHAFNFGVALASNDLVIMLGSDDRLEPWAIEDCLAAWERHKDLLGYYWMDVQYASGEQQSLACNAAMVHKDLWRHTGGFPVQSAVGPCDTILISMMLAKNGEAGNFYHVESAKPPYWYRDHGATFTKKNGAYYAAAGIVRDAFTVGWEKPTWPNLK